MKLLQSDKTTEHILKIQEYAETTNRAINAAIVALNNAYNYSWNLPDDELRDVLQMLLDNGKLQELFQNHYITATALNTIQNSTGYIGDRAIAVAGREFTIEDGVITLVALPTPQSELESSFEEPIIGETTTEETN